MTDREQQRGVALVVACLLVTLVTAYGSAMMVQSLTEQQTAQRFLRLSAAFQAAEAGLDRAITEFKVNSNWAGTSYTSTLKGGYDATVTNPSPTLRQVVATGHYPSNTTTAYGYQSRKVEGTVQLTSKSVFQYPLFGEEKVELKKKTITDSYDSSLGPYDPNNPGQKGHVATNSTDDKSIKLQQGTVVNGQVSVGPGMTDPSLAVDQDQDSVITGSPPIVSASQKLSLPAVDTTGLDCGADLKLPKESTYTFYESHGPYCFNKLEADKDSVIAVSGNVKVYANQVDFDKNLQVNVDGNPTQLLLQIYGTEKDVVIDKEGTFVGGIYAPGAKVRLKKEVSVYGALTAEQVTIDKDSQFHYDEALKNVGPAESSDVNLLSWREL